MIGRENVISGLQYTVEMFLFDPATGHSKDPDDLNAADRITFDACVGAIDLLKEQKPKPVKVDTRKVLDGETERVVNDLNIAKLMLCNPQTLTPELCIRIGQTITSAIVLLKEQANEYENGFNDAMLGKQELMYEDTDGKWHKKDW